MALAEHATVEAALAWLRASGARALTSDSRRLRPGDAFIAWPGGVVDGRQFVAAALAGGARACLVEAEGAEAWGFDALPEAPKIAALRGLKAATGEIASRFLGVPSARLQVLAVTGTNGKTSSAWWIAQALSRLGRRCGLVGTLGVGEPPDLVHTGLTTPDPITLQAAFGRFAAEGYQACAIEASSIGLVEQRLAGTHIRVAVFTNFTRDHLDYHGSMAAYWEAKARLFAWHGLRAAVVNIDDPQGEILARELRDRGLDLWTCSTSQPARLRAGALDYADGGLAFALSEDGGPALRVRSRLIGGYNASNLLGVLGALRALGLPLDVAASVCPELAPVPGRMQRVPAPAPGLPEVVVDYAHTPDALEKALQALRPLARERGGQLWCVFGCGGNRDASKRPMMGAIAARLADRVVLTSDNPRDEPPASILAQIEAGVASRGHLEVIEDRRAAIAHAVAQAAPADLILLAGKGHEDYQETAGVKRPFSDAAEAQAALVRRAPGEVPR